MLHYATAVRAALSHCVVLANLTLPSPSALAPLRDSAPTTVGPLSLRTPSTADFKLLLELWLVED